jgi:hypothetical protein
MNNLYLLSIGEGKSLFRPLSDKPHVPAPAREVMTLLWTMRRPQGLTGQDTVI